MADILLRASFKENEEETRPEDDMFDLNACGWVLMNGTLISLSFLYSGIVWGVRVIGRLLKVCFFHKENFLSVLLLLFL